MYSLSHILEGVVGIIKTTIPKYQADQKLIEERLDICRKCPNLKVSKVLNKEVFKCGLCGCPLRLRVKLKDKGCEGGFW